MGPLSFNLYESTLAAVPSVIIAFLFDFFFPYKEAPPSSGSNALYIEWMKLIPQVNKVLYPFYIPTVCLLERLSVERMEEVE